MGFTPSDSAAELPVRDSPALVKVHAVPVNGITWQVSPTEKASFLRNLNLIYSTSPPLRGPSPEERDKTVGDGFHAVPVNERLDRAGVLTADEN